MISISLWSILTLPSYLRLGFPKGLFPVDLPVKILKALLPSSILTTWLIHFNLNLLWKRSHIRFLSLRWRFLSSGELLYFMVCMDWMFQCYFSYCFLYCWPQARGVPSNVSVFLYLVYSKFFLYRKLTCRSLVIKEVKPKEKERTKEWKLRSLIFLSSLLWRIFFTEL